MRHVQLRPSGLAAIASLAVLTSCETPDRKIAAGSQTEECAAELVIALEAIARNEGYAYEVSDADAKTLFSSGKITKQYSRDGASYEASFGIGAEGGCNLALYREKIQRPGETTSRQKSRWLDLEVCACE